MMSREATTPSDVDTLAFEPFTEDGDGGIEIIDPIERHRYTLKTPSAVSAEPADEQQFRFPVDKAVSIQTTAIALPTVPLVHIRDGAGEELAAIEQFDQEEFSTGTYILELHTPIKLFLRLDGELAVQSDLNRVVFEFDGLTEVAIGARSYHRHPAGTVTTTAEPEDVMTAVSTFGSALKTTSPERSFPTLRGHPPSIELGDELAIPDGVTLPDTGIEIEVPPEFRFIYPAASLSYYLGAPLVPGEQPRIHTDTGFEYALTQPGAGTASGFEREAAQTLKQVFFLDCLTRTEGLYQVDLHERRAVEDDLALDFATLYEAPVAERLATYLEVPFSAIEDYLPDWKLTTHMEAAPGSAETLPFIVDDLAVIQTPTADDLTPVSPIEASAFDSMSPASTADGAENRSEAAFTRGGSARSAGIQNEGVGDTQDEANTDDLYIQPTAADSQEQAWIGEGTPIGASKATTEAYHNRLERTPNEGDIGITVVCNESEMDNERDLIDEIYGTRENLPFDVTVHQDLTQTELKAELASENDFLHYIGHIDDGGFDCVDGQLDATTLDTVNVDAFLLNACHSYEQGMALIEAGAISGIVTLNELLNHAAIQMGKTLARLLNSGFSLRCSVEIARDESIAGEQYHVVGDGGLTIAQTKTTIPYLLDVTTIDDQKHVEFKTYPTTEFGLGCTVSPYLSTDDERYLSSGATRTFKPSSEELERFFSLENMPVKIDGDLHWCAELELDDL